MSEVITKLRCWCGEMIDVTEEDLGFDELECPRCDLLNYVPETVELIEEQNATMQNDQEETERSHTRYRVMVEGEDGTEFCVRNGLPNDDLLDVIVDGFRTRYPDARRVFLEPEESCLSHYSLRELNNL